ncbi:MAG: type II toxin-antitoxin system HicB family antitoxin [Candidatus Bipolaricaulota bacterium]|nr:type II toxin-antitoxin system HicB family antitoxin [Candidatus Bipolaricaulota bacterium]MCS7274010.1 type II toxin-antitoxin system HicB family antitoxin [Candidatus Bipolaricaulota bacterium]MDW8111363.1 type II toxin-antitoxin system HicB family antitoxin [Candidatus Bipolaricaulota bacterium]MDW8329899.1 type II toxin-antitoxin system HicB family antitoxin [Candidatus Bipolaricaulota bacterium]
MKYQFTVVVERDEDGIYIASCPALQGCYSQGDTYEEALNNLKDAIRLHIEARYSVGEPIPIEIAVDRVEIHV